MPSLPKGKWCQCITYTLLLSFLSVAKYIVVFLFCACDTVLTKEFGLCNCCDFDATRPALWHFSWYICQKCLMMAKYPISIIAILLEPTRLIWQKYTPDKRRSSIWSTLPPGAFVQKFVQIFLICWVLYSSPFCIRYTITL